MAGLRSRCVGGLEAGGVDGVWGRSAQCPVGPAGVVDRDELGQEFLESFQVWRWWAGSEPAFECLVESFDLALGRGVTGASVLLDDPQVRDEDFERVGLVVSSSSSVREAGGVDHAVIGQGRCW